VTSRSRGLTDGAIKVVGLALVLLAAVGSAVVSRGMPADLAQADFGQLTKVVLCEIVSWIGFPLYAALLYSGFRHTRAVGRYALRLAVLAIVSEVPYDLATSGRVWNFSSQNPVFALLVALGVLFMLDRLRESGSATRVVVQILVCVAGAAWMLIFNVYLRMGLMPGGLVIYLFVLVFYFLDGRENLTAMVGAVLGAVALVAPAFGMVVLHFRNGLPGIAAPGKHIFYVLYPLCLLLVWLLSR